ncbi:MAG: TetR/AcrR family transcriptional regulator [Alphaproteobacteria bacterium]|nr:TetR/AcrR family transcriptional regulator [Alphaproteobacteria bacterium]
MPDQIKSKVDDPELVLRRRRQLADAAVELFSARGYHSTTIRDIAEHAEVSIGLIYQYVQDKEDLLFLALLQVLDSYKDQIPLALEGVAEPLERFCTAVRRYCRVNGESVAATVLAYRETKSLRKERRNLIKQKEVETNELIAACIRDCVEAGLFVDVDVEMFTYQIVMFSHAWALKAWRFSQEMDVEEYVDRGLRLMLRGVLTGRGERQLKSARCCGAWEAGA